MQGIHQLRSPRMCMIDGTSSIRTTVASMRMAAAMPTPITLTATSALGTKAAKTAIMTAAAAVMTRAVPASPATMASPVSPVRL
jgi:hypothetical protein